jgi:hypothetical protein
VLSLLRFPCWYSLVTLVFVVFHVGRGMIGQTYLNSANPSNPNYQGPTNPKAKSMERWQARWLFYVHDALLHICCTIFGFFCLLLAYRLVETGDGAAELAGLVFLALVGLAGITGQLAVMLSLGKFPSS